MVSVILSEEQMHYCLVLCQFEASGSFNGNEYDPDFWVLDRLS